jgi:hypothetical protein
VVGDGKTRKRFDSEKEIEEIRRDKRFKMEGRNGLGIRSSEDWIQGLYIGNVITSMHVFLPITIFMIIFIQLSGFCELTLT